MTDVRERMVDDLFESDTLMGMRIPEVRQLLGEPDREIDDELQYVYLVRERYSTDIDPDYIKVLVVQFHPNGNVVEYRIEK